MLNKKILKQIIDIVGQENTVTSKISLATYAYDASPYLGKPEVVVFPTNTEQVSAIVKVATENGISIMPRGAGTCLSGGAVAPKGSIVISLAKMNRILEIDPENQVAIVEAGVINKQVQIACEPYGLMFAPDPASQNVSTIGGNIAENAGGIRGVKYGCTKEHVLGLEVVLPSGDVITTGGFLTDIDADIDLTYIFCGSEGTLGLVTKAWLALTPINPDVKTMTAVFDNLEDAGICVSEIIAEGVIPTTMEIMDNTVIRAVEEYAKLGLPRDAEALLLLEIDGFPSELAVQEITILDAFKKNNALDYNIASNEKERQDLWQARRSVNGALGKLKPSNVVQDIVVPRDKLALMLKKVSKIAEKYGIIIGQLAHAGDGNLHPTLLYDHRIPKEADIIEEACDEIFKEALQLGGTLSGEHGIGLEKLKYMPLAFTEASLNYMTKVKSAFDPQNNFNPGKLLP